MTMQVHNQSPEAILQRIDAIMQELGELRKIVVNIQTKHSTDDLAQQLYGVLGQGTWEEYDLLKYHE